MAVRLQKRIADSGHCSRRQAEELIKSGKVSVNGKRALIGCSVEEKDVVRINGKLLSTARKVYLLLNKPPGYLSTTQEERGRRPVTDLVKVKERVYPVGRLDFMTEGLLLLSNDGQFKQFVTHPKHGVHKTYRVTTHAPFEVVGKLRKGVVIDGRKVEVSRVLQRKKRVVDVTIHEGRKHIVKRVFSKLGYDVVRLVRVRIGSLSIGSLKPGQWRHLKKTEVAALLRHKPKN